MKYALLLYADEGAWAGLDPEAQSQVMAEYNDVTEDMKRAGAYLGGEGLAPTSSATTLRLRDGKPMVTDGPFVESKEALGGYYLFDCASMSEALDWAARIPGADHGAIEVRPCYFDESEEAVA
jgi:hypothetical protein